MLLGIRVAQVDQECLGASISLALESAELQNQAETLRNLGRALDPF